MREATVSLKGITVTANYTGDGYPPWRGQDYERLPVYEYRVVVQAHNDGPIEHDTKAWGSMHDYQEGRFDAEEMAWMVLDELLGAAYDPDEFWSIAIPEDEAPSRERVEQILHTIEVAQRMYPALDANADAINEHR